MILDGGSHLRVKVDVNLLKSLARGRKFAVMNEELWIPLKYKKLSKFCFGCGRIMHTKDGCPVKDSVFKA